MKHQAVDGRRETRLVQTRAGHGQRGRRLLDSRAGSVDLERPGTRFDQVQPLSGRGFVSDGHVVGLTGSLYFL